MDGPERSWLQNPSFSKEQAQSLLAADSLLPASPRSRRGREGGEPSTDRLLSSSSDSEEQRISKPRKHDKERKERKRRHREGREKHRRKRHKHGGGSKDEPVKPQTIWFDESGLDPRDAYRLDSKPDTSNLRYAGLYSGDVASYRRRFGPHCLGLGNHQAVEWTDGRSQSLKKDRKKEKPTRYFRGGEAASLLRPQSDLVLKFTRRSTEKKMDASSSTQMEEYLALEGEREEGASKEEPEQPSVVTPEVYISRCTAEYNRSLLEDPHNVSLWVEFLAFQDEALVWGRLPGATSEETSVAYGRQKARLALFERKVAIYERALESNPLSVELLIGHMNLVQELWETEKLVRRWKDLVFQQPNKSQLWLSYIEFCQSRFSSFSTSSLTALYKKALSTLSSIQDGRLVSHRPDPDTSTSLLSIFVLYCNFLRQTGHSEKAIGSFQALVEFNFCCPIDLLSTEVSLKERVEFFEAFWDSGVPRFGEEGAVGWNNWMEASKKSSGTANQPRLGVLDVSVFRKATCEVGSGPGDGEKDELDPEISLIAGFPLREAWLVLEQRREREGGHPWRPGPEETEDDCTDPDRLVVFDDISAGLFSVTDQNLRLRLLLSFLHFLGAPLPSSPATPPLPRLSFTCLESPSEVYASPSSIMRNLLSASPLRSLPTTHQLLGTGHGYDLLGDGSLVQLTTCPSPLSEQDPAAVNFITNVCNQLLLLLPNVSIAQVWIHHELSLLPKALKLSAPLKPTKTLKSRFKALQKLIRGLLRLEPFRNDLSLWNCCALTENLVGNLDEAVRLYESVLSQYKPGPEWSSQLLELYVCFCSCLLGLEQSFTPTQRAQRDSKLALHALVCLAEGSSYEALGTKEPSVTPGRLLKARAVYEKSASQMEQGSPWIICHALFEYLTKGLTCAAGTLDRYTHTMAMQLSNASSSLHCDEERALIKSRLYTVLTFHSRLLVHHSLANPIQPALLRRVLERSLSLFPDDGCFLASYVSCELQSFISGNLRRYFDSHAPRADTPIPWLFAVWAELQRYRRLRSLREGGGTGEVLDEPETGTIHRIGALLRRAAESSNGRHCPLIWRLLMKFEVSRREGGLL